MITIGDLTICPANPAPHSGLIVCPACGGYGDQPMGIGEDPTDCDECNGDGSIPGPMPSPLAAVRFAGWYSHVRTRVVFSHDRCHALTQAEFDEKAALYRAAL